MAFYRNFPKDNDNNKINSINKNQIPVYNVPNMPSPKVPATPSPIAPSPITPGPIRDITRTPVPYLGGSEPPTCDIPQPVNNILYIQGYLRENIGRYIKAEFLIGTTSTEDREGVLKEVGNSYFILQEPRTDDLVLCDLYSVKFITFFY